MRVLRGRGESIGADRAITRRLREHTATTDEPGLRVWQPPRQLTFGRRDRRRPGYDDARAIATKMDFPPAERPVGGRAVAYTGTTIAFARTEPVVEDRTGIQDRYRTISTDVQVGLGELGVHALPGEPPESFCPGSHSLQAEGKVVGIAQRISNGVALTAGCLLVADHDAIAAVLSAVYDALSVPFDPDSVGSVSKAGGPDDPEIVRSTIERALLTTTEPTIESV
ncbi:lipoate--protein ligase family protein [Halocatena halophila]|uniref:lipoate--protein ligase family protein n=1 Tax=Halocatena halophila TaxID=2814576 RepID=UPI002ED08D4A